MIGEQAPHSAVPQSSPEPLPIARELVDRLSRAEIRYGIYKNVGALRAALAGRSDLDLLVASGDSAALRAILIDMKGIRGVPSRFHDNSGAGREDWFVPDFERGDFLHVDLSVGMLVGRKYRKRYLALTYDDVVDWQIADADIPIPVVSSREEARIALLQSVFRLPSRGGPWTPLGHSLSKQLIPFLSEKSADLSLTYHIGSEEVSCPVRLQGQRVEIESRAVGRLRELLHEKSLHPMLTSIQDLIVHQLRQFTYRAERTITLFSPAMSAHKRAPVPAGIVVAIVAPDGLGKSTQVARLASIFQKKFRCTTIYLGSGDGGWRFRRAVKVMYDKKRAQRQFEKDQNANRSRRKDRPRLKRLASVLWGLATAGERYVSAGLAIRLSKSGAIVISDRWPQNLQPGLLDGPRIPPPDSAPIARIFSSVERRLYKKMESYKPSLTIHLDGDFSTSRARKPCDIEEEAFESRLALMRRLREHDRAIRLVDSRAELEEVTRRLFECIWLYLWGRSLTRQQVSGPRPSSDALRTGAVPT